MSNYFHILRDIKKVSISNNFIFVDTEAKIEKLEKEKEKQTFKLACSIIWKKDIDSVLKRTYLDTQTFWKDVNSLFDSKQNKWTLYAHNTWYDFKLLNGFKHLQELGFDLTKQYVRNGVCILIFKREKDILQIYDTMNYIPMALNKIGKSLGIPKLEVDFNDVSLKELEIYCMRDTEIIYELIKKLIDFLEKYDLTSLRSTIGSLAFSSFRHKFYKPKKNKPWTQIAIHNWKRAIDLERESYKGGITDCYEVGKIGNCYKVDINSMYPAIMKDKRLPVKLLLYTKDSRCNQKDLFKLYNHCKNQNTTEYGFIMDVLIELPKDKAYILHKCKDKSRFIHGKFRTTLCSPELEFVEKYGKIHHIYQISMYKMAHILKSYAEFFNELKIKYSKENNQAFRMFAKLFMNTLYGKFAQRKIEFKEVKKGNYLYEKYKGFISDLIIEKKELIEKKVPIIYLGKLVNHFEVYLIFGKLWILKQTENNDKESFVPLSSFITSHARMMLIDYIEIAKKENCYYSDTDSFILNKKGYNNLLENGCIDDYELGKLKNEGFGKAEIFKPKFYRFNNLQKCKGVKKSSIKLKENSKEIVYKMPYWKQFKSDLKKGNSSWQDVEMRTKHISKLYDKGKILSNNRTEPYSYYEVKQMNLIEA